MERKELSAVVLELLEKETGETYPSVEESTTLREGLNLDSLDMAGLVLHIESRFGISIETELLDSIHSVGDLLNVLQTKIDTKAGRNKSAAPDRPAFALEPGADPTRALEKITAKRCDLIVVNDLTAMESDRTSVTVFDRRHACVGKKSGSKATVSRWLLRLLAAGLMEKPSAPFPPARPTG